MTTNSTRAARSRPTNPGQRMGPVPPVVGYFELVHQSVEAQREMAIHWTAWMSLVSGVAREHAVPPTGIVDDVIWQFVDADIRNG